jgi:hypothetical protein
LVGVVCSIERLLVSGMMVVGHFHHATKRSPSQATVFARAYNPSPWE